MDEIKIICIFLSLTHCKYHFLLSLTPDPARSICLTEACVTVASKIVEALDRSADPCQDFYEYACGGWVRKNPLPDGRSRWSTFNSIWDQNQAVLKHLLGKCRKTHTHTHMLILFVGWDLLSKSHCVHTTVYI